jgi:hypothetical protein
MLSTDWLIRAAEPTPTVRPVPTAQPSTRAQLRRAQPSSTTSIEVIRRAPGSRRKPLGRMQHENRWFYSCGGSLQLTVC